MKPNKLLLFLLVFFLACSCFAGSGRYIVILKQNQAMLDTESVNEDGIRNSVKQNGRNLIDKIRKLNSSVIESTEGMNDASEPPLKYEELWLTNSLAVEGDAKYLEELRNGSEVERVIPDFEITLEDFSSQQETAEDDDGYAEEDKILNWGVRFIKAPEAWEQFGTRGRGALVGILDTGVNTMHKVFRDENGSCRIVKYMDFGHPGTMPDDSSGHGTHVAGIVCGGEFRKQYIGVAPDARIIFAKVFGADGKSFFSVVIRALQWMSDPDGNPATRDYPCAVNCSFRVPTPSGMTDSSVLIEFNKIANNMLALGIIPVKSAGNDGANGPGSITAPGDSPFFLTVGAIDADGNRTSYSSIGRIGKSKPDLMAPGSRIFSGKHNDNGLVITKSGTSMAAPAVCGLIALMKSANPRLSARDIIKILVRTTTDIEEKGFDIKSGHGIIDAYRAVRSALNGSEAKLNNQLYQTIPWKDIKPPVDPYGNSGSDSKWKDIRFLDAESKEQE